MPQMKCVQSHACHWQSDEDRDPRSRSAALYSALYLLTLLSHALLEANRELQWHYIAERSAKTESLLSFAQ